MSGLLEQALRESGYEVTVAPNGKEALKVVEQQDLLLVDVMMPVMNGFEFVQHLRDSGSRVPILFLTAKDSLEDTVTGLDLGADDYIIKPFKLAELLARVRASLRRYRETKEILECSDIWMDTRSRKVRRGENWLYLSNTEFALLEMLMLRPGEPVSKQQMLKDIWNDAGYRDDNVVEVYMNYLRTKLETMGQSRLIHTVRGKGYVLENREI